MRKISLIIDFLNLFANILDKINNFINLLIELYHMFMC